LDYLLKAVGNALAEGIEMGPNLPDLCAQLADFAPQFLYVALNLHSQLLLVGLEHTQIGLYALKLLPNEAKINVVVRHATKLPQSARRDSPRGNVTD